MDLVITYVDSADPKWRDTYIGQCIRHGRRIDLNSQRFRSWDTLRFLLRGVDECMPWIRRLHLVVESPSQVPAWLSRENVNVVTHQDIIPERFLPTYNSTVIELFIHRIPGIAPRFIYANDDMFPLSKLNPGDFYDIGGYPRLSISTSHYNDNQNIYRHHLHNGETLARSILGLPANDATVTKTGHNLNPMLKETWDTLWRQGRERLEQSCTPFRTSVNINQEIHSCWHILTGRYSQSQRRTAYREMNQVDEAADIITSSAYSTDVQLLCVNDAKSVNAAREMQTLHRAFTSRFPTPSIYEQ